MLPSVIRDREPVRILKGVEMRCLGALGLVLALWTGVPAGVFDTPQTVPRGAYAVGIEHQVWVEPFSFCLLYTSPSPRD